MDQYSKGFLFGAAVFQLTTESFAKVLDCTLVRSEPTKSAALGTEHVLLHVSQKSLAFLVLPLIVSRSLPWVRNSSTIVTTLFFGLVSTFAAVYMLTPPPAK
mmetsp:Transcript_73693/g.196061  ORF Transcript_73693/g.196061 Transcript_73693/m.196061 type:complete len:102 (+) Transcript_73693:2048-2353(+)